MAKQALSELLSYNSTNTAASMTQSREMLLNNLRTNLTYVYLEEGAMRQRKKHFSLIEMLRCGSLSKNILLDMIKANPESINETCGLGGNAVHYACRVRCSSEIICALIEYMPLSLKRKDVYQELPLHVALQNGCGIDVIRTMLYYYPASLHVHNNDKELPLNLAVICDATEDVIAFLIKQDPSGLVKEDSIGHSAFHSILSRPSSLGLVHYCLESYPTVVEQKGANGQLPLHTAAMYSTASIVRLLIQKYNEAVLVKDNEGNLPLHCAIIEGSSLNVIKMLVNESRECLQIQGVRGLVPLELALSCNASVEIVRFLCEASI